MALPWILAAKVAKGAMDRQSQAGDALVQAAMGGQSNPLQRPNISNDNSFSSKLIDLLEKKMSKPKKQAQQNQIPSVDLSAIKDSYMTDYKGSL